MDATMTIALMRWGSDVPRKKDQTQPDYDGFGERLAKLRQAAGFSQRELAQEVGISQRMLAYYEKHAAKPPFEILPELAEVLDVSVEVLLGTDKPKKKKPTVNRRLLSKMRQIEQLPKRDQQAIMRTIDAFLSRA